MIRTSLWHLNQEQLLALFRLRDVRGYKRVLYQGCVSDQKARVHMEGADHERLKVRSPPLCEAVTNFPVIVDPMRRVELLRILRRCESIVEPGFESFNFVFTGLQIVPRSVMLG